MLRLRKAASCAGAVLFVAVIMLASAEAQPRLGNTQPGFTGGIPLLSVTGLYVSSFSAVPFAETMPLAEAAIFAEIDACKLITRAEAEQVMGEKLKEGDGGPASMQGGTICRYESPDSMSAKYVSIRVESPNFNWAKYKEDKKVEGEKMRPKRGYIRPVPGLGKEAYFARHVLHVLTDKGILSIAIFKDPADAANGEEKETKTESAEKALAEIALKRM